MGFNGSGMQESSKWHVRRRIRKCLNKARKKLYPNDAFKLVNQFILSKKIEILRKGGNI